MSMISRSADNKSAEFVSSIDLSSVIRLCLTNPRAPNFHYVQRGTRMWQVASRHWLSICTMKLAALKRRETSFTEYKLKLSRWQHTKGSYSQMYYTIRCA